MEIIEIREELQQILREFLAEYAAASETSWRRHWSRCGSGYLLPSRGRFFTEEERSAFAMTAGQLRARAERILSGADVVPADHDLPWMVISRKQQLEEIRRAFSLMNETEAEAGRWSGTYPAYVERLIEEISPVAYHKRIGGNET